MAHLMRALAEGQVFQGEPGPDGAPRGEPSAHLPPTAFVNDHLPPTAFVNSNQTHDQVGNRAEGERLIALAGEDAARVAHALLLLGCSSLQADVEAGRRAEFAAFPGHAGEVAPAGASDTFERSRPYLGDPARRADWETLTADLLRFRHDRVVPLVASGREGRAEVRQLGPRSILAAWPFRAGRLEIVVNLGALPAGDVPGAGDFVLGDPARDPWALTARVMP